MKIPTDDKFFYGFSFTIITQINSTSNELLFYSYEKGNLKGFCRNILGESLIENQSIAKNRLLFYDINLSLVDAFEHSKDLRRLKEKPEKIGKLFKD